MAHSHWPGFDGKLRSVWNRKTVRAYTDTIIWGWLKQTPHIYSQFLTDSHCFPSRLCTRLKHLAQVIHLFWVNWRANDSFKRCHYTDHSIIRVGDTLCKIVWRNQYCFQRKKHDSFIIPVTNVGPHGMPHKWVILALIHRRVTRASLTFLCTHFSEPGLFTDA